MVGRDLTARRSRSARGHVRQTRVIAGLAVLVLAAAIASDQFANAFWSHHWLLTSLVSSLVVVAVSVAVVNEALERPSADAGACSLSTCCLSSTARPA
jgi:hypothetical protein